MVLGTKIFRWYCLASSMTLWRPEQNTEIIRIEITLLSKLCHELNELSHPISGFSDIGQYVN